MSRELELVTAAALADGRRGPQPAPAGAGAKHAAVHTECLNCAAPLHGPYCYSCGQPADDHHRSIFHLMWEAVEGLTHLDGRLARTVPALFLRPGALARDHFEGRRQRHVPPFRLFLVCLLLFMLSLETAVGHGSGGGVRATTPDGKPVHLGDTVTVRDKDGSTSKVRVPSAEEISRMAGGRVTPAQVAAAVAAEDRHDPDTPAPASKTAPPPPPPQAPAGPHIAFGPRPQGSGLASVQVDGRPAGPERALDAFDKASKKHSALGAWLVEHGKKARESREYFKSVAFEWAHRLAILLLPIFALLLTGCYFYKRQFYVYDHLVVSMHFLSFVFLVSAIGYILPEPVRGWAILVASAWTPVNLFMTLRGAYGSGVIGAGVRTFGLWVASIVLFTLLLLGILAVALGEM